MKRLLAMVFVALFVLGGCSNAKTFTGEKINEGVEHNYACPTFGFFADGERLFFSADGFYNMGVFCADSNGTHKLCDDRSMEEGSLTGELYAQGNTVWFTAYTEDEFVFYEYDIANKSAREICGGKGRVEQWVIRAGVLYFTQYTDPYSARGLYQCDLRTLETRVIYEPVLWFGVVENTVYYVTEGLTYTLWECRNGGEPVTVYDDLAGGEARGFSALFVTENFFAYQLCETLSDTLTILDMRSNNVSTVTLPKTMQKAVAAKNYAFLTLCDEAVASEEDGLYRLCLKNGELEVLQKGLAEAQTLFALNDACVLVSIPENKWFIAKKNVYRVTCEDTEPLLLYSY